jgi:nucleotide-binding universal stress UspA family protein
MATVERILVPLDFSPGAMHALTWAEDLAHRFGAELLLLHVSQSEAVLPGSQVARQDTEIAGRELDRLAERLRARGHPVRTAVRPGSPADGILRVANNEHVGLIVMGTHGRADLAHILLGSVADRVLRRASCAVLTVRHPDRRTAAGG